MSDCPSDRTLERLGAGGLGEATFAGLEEHVEACPRCQQALQAVVGDDLHAGGASLPRPGEIPSVSGFVVERELGRGGFGVVYLARDTTLNRQVALKFLAGDRGALSGGSRRLAEAQTLSGLRHPNIVPLYSVVEEQGWTILVLEYVPGGTLKQRLSGPLEPQMAALVMERIARTIGYVHDAGLVHLDIKPSNILVDGGAETGLETAVLKVSDFGISLTVSGLLSGPGGGRGTPSYMAPEQAGVTGAAIGPASDVYALGAVLYQLLTGRPSVPAPAVVEESGRRSRPRTPTVVQSKGDRHIFPDNAAGDDRRPCECRQFIAGKMSQSPACEPLQESDLMDRTPCEALALLGSVPPVAPRRLNRRVPRDLELICSKCLARLPQGRYPSAGAVADDLRRYIEGRRISIRPVASLEQVTRWCRRRPAIATLAVMLVVTIVASLAGLGYLLRQSESERLRAIQARELAERNEATASRTLEELEVWIQRVLAEPRLLEEKRHSALIEDIQSLTEKLRGDEDSVLRMAATVSMLQRDLASKLSVQKNDRGLAEAAALLARSRRHLLDCLNYKPAELLREEYLLTLVEAGTVASFHDAIDEIANCEDEVASLAPSLARAGLRLDALLHASRARLAVAYNQQLLRNDEVRLQFLRANLTMLEAMFADEATVPDLRLQKGLTLALLGRTDEAVSILRDLAALDPGEWRWFHDAQGQLREWLARPALEAVFRTGSRHTELDASALGPQTDRLTELIRRQARSIGLGEPDVPVIAMVACDPIQNACAAERRWDRVDRGVDSAHRFLAFARQVALEYPERFESQLVIGQAYHQVAKNAWHFDDGPAAIVAMREAIAAARRAEELAPEQTAPRWLAADLERRLAKAERDLVEQQSEPRSK